MHRAIASVLCFVVAAAWSPTGVAGSRRDTERTPDRASGRRDAPVSVVRRTIPAHFETNAGQAPAEFDFVARCDGYRAFVGPGIAVVDCERAALRIALDGARDTTPDVRGHELAGRASYFVGNDPASHITDIPLTSGAAYADVAATTDCVFTIRDRRLEFTFTVDGATEPELRVDGAAPPTLDPDGGLTVEMPRGRARISAPVAWQVEPDGTRVGVAARYSLAGDGSVTIALGPRDVRRPTVIDPTVSYVSYFGTAAYDTISAADVGSDGSLYFGGETASASFPVTAGAYATTKPSPAGGDDMFVAKLSSDGSSIVWATYYGTTGADDSVSAIEVLPDGSVLCGGPAASGLPTTTGTLHATAPAPGVQCYIARFGSAGTTLVSASYTNTSNVLFGPRALSGGDYVFADRDSVFRMASDMKSLVWTTRVTIPTASSSYIKDVHVDSADGVWLTGQNLPRTTGAYTPQSPGSNAASVVSMTAGGAIRWAAGVNGTGAAEGIRIAADGLGRPTIAGVSTAPTLPVTPGTAQTTRSGTSDVFLAGLSADGTKLRVCTWFGGSGSSENVTGLQVHATGAALVTGTCQSQGVPTASAFQSTYGGGASDAYVAKFAPAGGLLWSSFAGGSGSEGTTIVAIGDDGSAVIAGATSSTDIAASGGYQSSAPGSTDGAYLFVPDTLPTTVTFPAITSTAFPTWTAGKSFSEYVTWTGGEAPYAVSIFSGSAPPGLSLATDGRLSGTPTTAGSNTFRVRVTDTHGTCDELDQFLLVNPAPAVSTSSVTSWTVQRPFSQSLSASGGTGNLAWSLSSGTPPSGISLAADGTLSGTPSAVGSRTFQVRVTDEVGAIATRSLTMTVNPPPRVLPTAPPTWTERRILNHVFSAVDGTPPLTWSVASGTLPVTFFDADFHRFADLTKTAGTYDYTLRVTDAAGAVSDLPFTQIVNPRPEIQTFRYPPAAIGRPYRAATRSSGGTAPFAWEEGSTALHAGLTIDPADGTIGGTPTASSGDVVEVALTDLAGATAARTAELRCAAPLDLATRRTRSSFDIPEEGSARLFEYVELTAGTLLDIVVTGGGTKERGPLLRIYDAGGDEISTTGFLTSKLKSATLRGFPAPATGRYFIAIDPVSGSTGRLKHVVSIRPATRGDGTVEAAPDSDVAVGIAAPTGAKVTITLRPAPRSEARPRLAAFEAPGGTDLVPDGRIRKKGATLTFTPAEPLAGGDYTLRFGTEGPASGALRWSASIRLPKRHVFDLAGLPSGDPEDE